MAKRKRTDSVKLHHKITRVGLIATYDEKHHRYLVTSVFDKLGIAHHYDGHQLVLVLTSDPFHIKFGRVFDFTNLAKMSMSLDFIRSDRVYRLTLTPSPELVVSGHLVEAIRRGWTRSWLVTQMITAMKNQVSFWGLLNTSPTIHHGEARRSLSCIKIRAIEIDMSFDKETVTVKLRYTSNFIVGKFIAAICDTHTSCKQHSAANFVFQLNDVWDGWRDEPLSYVVDKIIDVFITPDVALAFSQNHFGSVQVFMTKNGVAQPIWNEAGLSWWRQCHLFFVDAQIRQTVMTKYNALLTNVLHDISRRVFSED